MKLIYFIKMLRIEDWLKMVFWIPLAGLVLASYSLNNFILTAIISFFILSYGYAINNYYDIEIDKKNNRKIEKNTNPLAKELISKKNSLALIIFLLLVPLYLASQISFTSFMLVLLIVLGFTFYSAKIIRLKEKPFIDVVTISLFAGFFPFLLGIGLAGETINFSFFLVALLFALLCGNEVIAHYIRDYEQDLGNTRTTVIRIGKRKSYFILFLLLVISFLLFEFIILKYYSDIQRLLFYLAVCLLFFWWLPLRLTSDLVKERIKTKEILESVFLRK